MSDTERGDGSRGELTERERQVLEAVVRSYVQNAEPAASRTLSRTFDLGVSPATIRNTMSDLEDKGYLLHPHASAGRVPTDLAYRFFVDEVMDPHPLSARERSRIQRELEPGGTSAVDSLVRQAASALSVLSRELGLAIAPRIDDAVIEKLELIRLPGRKVLLVAMIRSGLVRTVYVHLESEVPDDTLATLNLILNERLAGLSLRELQETLPERLRDTAGDDPSTQQLLNIFMQSGAELFDWSSFQAAGVHLGQASVLAAQPEFTSGERLKDLIALTEQREFLARVLTQRQHPGGLRITIGTENASRELNDFTLVTAEYQVGDLKGVIGVIGPTRMPYEKVIAIVDYTSSLVNEMLRG